MIDVNRKIVVQLQTRWVNNPVLDVYWTDGKVIHGGYESGNGKTVGEWSATTGFCTDGHFHADIKNESLKVLVYLKRHKKNGRHFVTKHMDLGKDAEIIGTAYVNEGVFVDESNRKPYHKGCHGVSECDCESCGGKSLL